MNPGRRRQLALSVRGQAVVPRSGRPLPHRPERQAALRPGAAGGEQCRAGDEDRGCVRPLRAAAGDGGGGAGNIWVEGGVMVGADSS